MNKEDHVVVEAPLAIRLQSGSPDHRQWHDLAITMRTPGQDEALALGLLFSEGIIARRDQVIQLEAYTRDDQDHVDLQLHPDLSFDPAEQARYSYTNSSCGICGKVNLDYLEQINCYFPQPQQPQWSAEQLYQLPETLRAVQDLFIHTGGIHAAALFDPDGKLLLHQEDVGRHNAVDKLIGQALDQGRIPWRGNMVLVSGRAGFELVQKCVMAGTACMLAIGAPTSLAIELADLAGMTLIGFLRDQRFNIYTHPERILL